MASNLLERFIHWNLTVVFIPTSNSRNISPEKISSRIFYLKFLLYCITQDSSKPLLTDFVS